LVERSRAAARWVVPFHRAYRSGREVDEVARVIAGEHWGGAGPITADCERLLELELGASRVLLTTSCTHALELASLLLDLGPGDEVVVPSFTFPSTANAFALRRARIVFCDVRPDTLALDERQLERLITDRTRAIVPVHYAGVACDMDAIAKLAKSAGISVVEDNAHGLFGRYRGEYLGTLGSLGALSFHATKNFSCGEGGALIINDSSLIERAEIVREKGTNRVQFVRGDVELYSWRVLGSSFVMAEILAAVLRVQLEARSEISNKRNALWNRYHAELDDWARQQRVRLPLVPSECDHPAHLFYVILPNAHDQDAFIEHLARNGVQAVTHYRALHASDAGRLLGEAPLGAPIAEDVASRLVRLPLYPHLALREQDLVVRAVTSYRCGGAS
jgi:dTDP-4-amino-4,6-dideoxygalactose transaminase